MKSTAYLFLGLSFIASCKTKPANQNEDQQKFETIGEIERIDDRMNELIPNDARIEILASGFNWSEGPLWIEEGEYLIFSDVPENTIYKWSETDSISVFLKPSGNTGKGQGEGSNGLLLNKENQLVLCQHGDRRMAVMKSDLDNPKPEFESITDNYQGMKYNSPNDAVYDSHGNLYFTDPPYGLPGQDDDPEKELSFQGVYRLSPDGVLTLLTDKLTRPNGIGLSPDEKTLYVANSDPKASVWMAYSLSDEGEILKEWLFHDGTGAEGSGLPDGLKVDNAGSIWGTGPGGVWVFAPDGQLLGKIKTVETTANCAFNEDKSVLYLTSDDYLMRVILKN